MKSFFSKLDIKSWLILGLLVLALFFGYKWYFSGDDGSKARVEQLEKENKELVEERDANNLLISTLELEVENLAEIIKVKEEIIASLDEEVARLDGQVQESKKKLEDLKKELQEKLDKIEELKKNPIKREGDDLLNSLKDKLNN